MATNPRPMQRDIFAESDNPSLGLLASVRTLLFQPRQFFKQNSIGKHSITVALLILALIAYSAVQQATPASTPIDSGGMPPMDGGGGMPPMDGGAGIPLDGGTSSSSSDPSQAWMTGLSAAGTQVIYWAVLTILLSEVSLINGKAPQFGTNLQIAIWATLPLALMAGVQTLFIMGGGSIGEAGFAGFLDEWEAYAGFHIVLKSAVYALASQFSLFWLWSLALLYLGAREALKGKRWAIILVIALWISSLVAAFGYQSFQELKDAQVLPEMPIEMMPEGEMPMEGEMPLEGESPMEGEFSSESGESSPDDEGHPVEAPVRSGGKG